jgi:rhodanese-related sulfurtransferase
MTTETMQAGARTMDGGDLEIARQAGDVRVVDVRTPAEFEAVRIPDSYNVPLDELPKHFDALGRTPGRIALVCRTGARSRKAMELLAERGVQDVVMVEGGVAAWEASDRTVAVGRKRLPLERQVRIAAGGMAALGGALALTVSPLWAILPTFVGSGLVFAGITDTCGLAMVLSRLPYNRPASVDVDESVRALIEGRPAPEPARSAEAQGGARTCAA